MQSQVDALLDIHVLVEIRRKHLIDRLIIDRGGRRLGKMAAVEARIRLRLHDLADQRGNLLELLDGSFLSHAGGEHHVTLLHPAVVAQRNLE